jgi:sensor histidine kinase regulating citrate/malate metabolism
MLAKKDYFGAAKLMIAAKCTSHFDNFDLVAGLIQMSKKDVAKQLISATTGEQQKALVNKVIIFNANDSHY